MPCETVVEKKEAEYRALFRQVSPSVVIVEQVGRVDYFCIGSVILSEDESTFILTQFKIAASHENLSVRFSNGFKQSAALLVRLGSKLCVLVTKFYAKCKAVQFFEGDIDHTFVAAIAPASRSSVYNIPGFVIQRSREAGRYSDQGVTEGSGNYFTFTCQYGDCSANRVSRLISGPVFDLSAQVLGVVTGDMGFYDWPVGDPAKMGFNLKAAIRASSLQALLRNELAGGNDWHSGLKLKQIALQAKPAA
ncbi:hypothetical protein ACP4OV_026247 [Aristida adscensionis]